MPHALLAWLGRGEYSARTMSLVRLRTSLLALLLSHVPHSAFGADIHPPGFRPLPTGANAIVGGRIVVKPGEVIENGTVLIRDGLIERVGNDIALPADARVWSASGLTVYAGFIEPYLPLGGSNAPVSTSATEPVGRDSLTAGGVNFFGLPSQRTDLGATGPGHELSKISPEFRAVREFTPDRKRNESFRELGFATAVIAPSRGIIQGTSPMVSLAEEDPNMLIVRPAVFQHVAFETRDGAAERFYPASLMGAIAAIRQSFFDAQHYGIEQAAWLKNPSGRPRPEYNPSLEALGAAAKGERRVLFEPGSALMVDRAARMAQELKLNFAIVSCGEEWRRPDLAKAAGAMFIVPVNFPKLPKWPDEADWEQATLDQLRAWDWAAENPALLRRQNLEIALTTYGLSDQKEFRKNVRMAIERGLSEDDALAALTTVPAKLCGVEKQLGTIEPGKIANLTIVDGKGYFDAESRVREVWIDGQNYHVLPAKEVAKKDEAKDESKENGEKESKAKSDREKRENDLKELQKKRVAQSPLEERGPITVNRQNRDASLVIIGGTIWTCSSNHILTNVFMEVVNGKIASFPGSLRWSGPTLEARGLHITPGLIDCHSHSAILGSVNEGSLPSSAMCRIGDVVNSETINIRQQLAGGLTVANLLHGSANPIGGQNQVIKLRDGASPEALKFEGAPAGIKFALGENVKQSNWGERATTRYPQTRMGVPVFHENRFTAAKQYLDAQAEFAQKGGVPPRRNLELEALGEIIEGKRLIHCHSYRQDEILAFLRVMENFKVRVGTLQHVLEGYKVADEIAAHGAGASCFSDWWAYKFEVYDAIPFAGSLMHERGVTVSFNSDSSDLARRMNTEAAKAVKYGGTSEIEALKFVTLNPAKQLGIDARVGSLEPGKDADFVVWSGNPLDSRSVVLQTWIDGKKYFDREVALHRAATLAKERDDLIAKAKKIARLSRTTAGGTGESGKDDGSFFRGSLEHAFDGVSRDCMDEEGH
jgi:imidazolonepropionase-like amidohydrolase